MYVKRAGFRMVAAAAYVMAGTAASADSLEMALVQAYQNNPQVNAQRALVRATDENVPQALAGYRPRISGTYNYGVAWTDTVNEIQVPVRNQAGLTIGGVGQRGRDVSRFYPAAYGGTVSQTIFNGFQTGNRTRQAEAQVFSARETLRVIEQTVLLDAATAYMNVLRDSAIYDLQKRNVEVLQEQLRQTRDRFNVGEVTRTDVAQAESRVAAGQSQMLTAQANLTTSRAIYRRVIGLDPGKLVAGYPGRPILAALPRSGGSAGPSGKSVGQRSGIWRRRCTIAGEGERRRRSIRPLPSPVLQQQQYHPNDSTLRNMNASVVGQLTVPIYQGGAEYSLIRQAKETVGQRRLELAINRDQARANVVQAWGQLDAAKAQIDATKSQVTAAEIALNGVREEARVGQRTTLDVLECTAGTGECAGGARHRAARPRGRVLHAARGGRAAVDPGARACRSRSTIR